MYARIGHPHCPLCGEEIKKLSNEEILNFVLGKVKDSEKKNSEIMILSPIVRGRKGEYYQLLYDLLGKGFSEIRLDGVMKKLREQITLSKNKAHNIDVLVDNFPIREFTDEDIAKVANTYHNWRGTNGSKYEDVAGFCKVATLDEIAEHDYVLTPGRYVGSAEVEDDDEVFEEKIKRLTGELKEQFTESDKLEKQIKENLKKIGYEL
ncbi:MAG: N-6 DNA methylase [Patescibacteria group bacterium]